MHYVSSSKFFAPNETDDKPVNPVKALNARLEEMLERVISFKIS